jgi:hypothetical protein
MRGVIRIPMSLIALLVVTAIALPFCYLAVLLRRGLGLSEMPYDPLFIFAGLAVGFVFAHLLGAWMSREK